MVGEDCLYTSTGNFSQMSMSDEQQLVHILNILNLVSVHHGVCVLNLVSIQLCVHTAVVNFGIFKIQIPRYPVRWYGRTSIILYLVLVLLI